MDRRSFLALIAAAPIAALAPLSKVLANPQLGLSMRLMRSFDAAACEAESMRSAVIFMKLAEANRGLFSPENIAFANRMTGRPAVSRQ